MPQGKGTYGSQIGRPSKKGKKKYNIGGNVDPFSARNPEGVPMEQAMDMIEDANMANVGQEGQEGQEGLPTSNAQERSQMSPDVEQYKEGGKVDVTDIVKDVEKYQKVQDESFEWIDTPLREQDPDIYTRENIKKMQDKYGKAYREKKKKVSKKREKILKGKKMKKGGKVTEIKSKLRMPLRGGKKVTDPKMLEELKKAGKFPFEDFKEQHIIKKFNTEKRRAEREKKKGKK